MSIEGVVYGLIAISEVKSVGVKNSQVRVKLLHPANIDWESVLSKAGAEPVIGEEGTGEKPVSYTFLLKGVTYNLTFNYTARNEYRQRRAA